MSINSNDQWIIFRQLNCFWNWICSILWLNNWQLDLVGMPIFIVLFLEYARKLAFLVVECASQLVGLHLDNELFSCKQGQCYCIIILVKAHLRVVFHMNSVRITSCRFFFLFVIVVVVVLISYLYQILFLSAYPWISLMTKQSCAHELNICVNPVVIIEFEI